MPNTILTLTNVRDEIMSALGSADVEVELAESDIEKCLKESIRKYNRYRPIRKRATVSVTTTQGRYAVTHPGLQGIVELEFVERSLVSGDPFDPFYQDSVGLSMSGDTHGEYMQKRQYIEQARRISGSEPEWEQQWEDGSLYLYISVSYAVDVSYLYTMHVTPDNVTDTGMQHIPDGDTDWIIDYATAFAKGIVARKRGKFGGVMTPDGTESTVDASELSEESKSSIESLIESIKRRRRPLLPEIE